MGTNAFLTQAALELAARPPNAGTNAFVTQACIEMIIGPVVVPPAPPAIISRGNALAGGARLSRCCPVPYVKHKPEQLAEYDLAVPLNGQRVFAPGVFEAPADALVHPFLTYAVPLGFYFQLEFLVLNYFGGGWVPGDGNVIFSLDVNTSGNPSAQGIPVKNYASVLVPLGSFQKPWPFHPGVESAFSPRDILRAKVQTNPVAIPPGAPNRFAAAFVGYLYPVN
jgi:hypothetical protein